MTKTDTLSERQEQAINLILLGQSDQAVAEAIGVARQTVNKWKHQNLLFQATLNSQRQELWASHYEELRSLIKLAITVLRENLVDDENKKLRQEAALHILKGTGLLYAQSFKPYGPTTVSEMEEEEMDKQNLLNIFGSMKSQKLTRNG